MYLSFPMHRGPELPRACLFYSISNFCGWFPPLEKRGQQEESGGRADAAIRDIEGRPGIGKAHMEIEQKEIHHMPVQETVGQIAHDPSKEQSHAPAGEAIRERPTEIEE